MRRKAESLEQDIRLEELHEMEEFIPMTARERTRVRNWVYNGHSVDSNPWHYKDAYGYELNYLEGYHRHLEEKWGDYYRPFYKVVKTDPPMYGEVYDELSF